MATLSPLEQTLPMDPTIRRRASARRNFRLRRQRDGRVQLGVRLQARSQTDEPVHPRHPSPREDCGAEGDEDSGSAFAGGGVVAVGGRDCPDDRGDHQHEDGDDEDEGQESADDSAKVSDAAEAVEVGEDAHHAPTFTVTCR